MKEIVRVMIGQSAIYRGYVIEVSENCALILKDGKEVAEPKTVGEAIDLIDSLKTMELVEKRFQNR